MAQFQSLLLMCLCPGKLEKEFLLSQFFFLLLTRQDPKTLDEDSQ
jgi:hypothetical protein